MEKSKISSIIRCVVCCLIVMATATGVKAQDVIENSLRDNWYVQGGLDMTLQCPYGKDFHQVFPKGKSFGIDIAGGRWFSPQIGLRLHLNWENGIKLFRNGHLEWLSPNDEGKSNMDCGGYFNITCDVPVSVSNIVMGYDAQRLWNGYVYARMGIISNRATHSGSPLVGGGFGGSWRVGERLHIFSELGMQATTSEFYYKVAHTGLSVKTGFNCMFVWVAGVQYTFGTSTWQTTANK